MEHDESQDLWGAGERYEPYVGRWSRRVAARFVAWLALPPGRDWLDVGCGTGALTEAVLAQATPSSVRGIDASAGFVTHARAHVGDPRAAFELGDAQSLPLSDGSVDAAVSALLLNFVPDPAQAAAEMARVVRRDGVVAGYVWDYAARMQLVRLFWDVAASLDPAAAALDEGRRFPLCRPEALAALLRGAGLREIEVCAIEVATDFIDFDDYWSPFLGGQGPAPHYAMSLEPARREALRDRLRERLPTAADGVIRLVARAWAVRGRVA